jgi:hypothetical protein
MSLMSALPAAAGSSSPNARPANLLEGNAAGLGRRHRQCLVDDDARDAGLRRARGEQGQGGHGQRAVQRGQAMGCGHGKSSKRCG